MKHKLSKFQRKKLIAKAHKLLDRVDNYLDVIAEKLTTTRIVKEGE